MGKNNALRIASQGQEMAYVASELVERGDFRRYALVTEQKHIKEGKILYIHIAIAGTVK